MIKRKLYVKDNGGILHHPNCHHPDCDGECINETNKT